MGFVQKKSTSGATVFLFDSMAEVMELCSTVRYKHRDTSFIGEPLENWEAVQARLNRVWAEGTFILDQCFNKLSEIEIPDLACCTRQQSFSFTDGDDVDIDRLLAGEPMLLTAQRVVANAQEVTIITDSTSPFHVQSIDVLWRGACALALTKILESRGYKVELWVTDGEASMGRVVTACCLKRAVDPIDQESTINAMAGWYYRSVQFTLLEAIGNILRDRPILSCYKPAPADLDQISRDEHRIYCSGVFSFEGAVGVIQSELKEFQPVNRGEQNEN